MADSGIARLAGNADVLLNKGTLLAGTTKLQSAAVWIPYVSTWFSESFRYSKKLACNKKERLSSSESLVGTGIPPWLKTAHKQSCRAADWQVFRIRSSWY